MGLIANLLNRKSVPKHQVDSSLQMLDMLKEKRGAELGKYLDLMIDPRDRPTPSAPSTLEDLDDRGPIDSSTYSLPLSAIVYLNQEAEADRGSDDGPQTGDPIETGINTFFDEFARQASAYNLTASSEELRMGIERPHFSSESFPETSGKPVRNACLHTEHWGIFFFGHGTNIDVYLLPYDAQTSVTFQEVRSDGCQPLLAVTTRTGSAGLEWYVDGKRFSRDRMPDLSRLLLNDLIQVATGSKD